MTRNSTKTLTKKGQQISIRTSQQYISTLKKVQNNKKLANSSETLNINEVQKEFLKNTNDSLKLVDKFSNSNKSNSGDSEVEESDEEYEDELRVEDEDIIMQGITDSADDENNEERSKANTDSSDDENSEEKSEEESSNEEDEDMEEKYSVILEDTTKISSKKRQKEKEQNKIQNKTTKKEIAEVNYF
jgi:hypothetical protein